MKVLLTGSSGLIGSHLLELLLDSSHEISILQRAGIHADSARIHDSRLTVFEADYESAETLQAAVAEQHIIIHCAGVTKVRHYSDFFRYNTRVTENLIAAIQAVNPRLKRLIYFSSLAAAGPADKDQPLTEDQPPHPISWYGKSKLEAEDRLRRSGLYYTIVRPCAVYGPRDKDVFVYFKLLNHRLAPIIG
ncbi:MAG: NAD(P)-dependent oxidoreductase, partial [Candidatus Delongbacteria bacterium]|nr:NAD(P)-dependent oxidoreductase [Candidatus Delongbacteria bacterium]